MATEPQEITAEKPEKVAKKPVGKRKKKVKKTITRGKVFICATFNNTIITITDLEGNVLVWASAGGAGFKGARKSTPFAAQIAAQNAVQKARDLGLRTVEVFVKGPGAGRETALKALGQGRFQVTRIQDVTPIPHNGCRPPKKRRV